MRLHQTDDDVDDDDCDVAADDAAAVAVVAATVMVGSNHSLIDFIEIYEMLCWFGNFIKLLLLLWLLDWLIVDDGVLKTWNFKCVSLSLSLSFTCQFQSQAENFLACAICFLKVVQLFYNSASYFCLYDFALNMQFFVCFVCLVLFCFSLQLNCKRHKKEKHTSN